MLSWVAIDCQLAHPGCGTGIYCNKDTLGCGLELHSAPMLEVQTQGCSLHIAAVLEQRMGKIVPVLLAGGSGSRLWPLSRNSLPKQLLPLIGGETLLQHTIRRISDRPLFDDVMIIANAEHRDLVAEQVRATGVKRARIVLEPEGRNTAPASAVAAILAAREDPGSTILLMPTDHIIPDRENFHSTVEIGLVAAERGAFVLFGIEPAGPETGYGYVLAEEYEDFGPSIHKVVAFKEKPTAKMAEGFLKTGGYTWNSGIYLLPARGLCVELQRLEPDLIGLCETAVGAAEDAGDFLYLPPQFSQVPDISIDHAVMERTDKAYLVPAVFPWHDVGTWTALWELGEKNVDGTVSLGNIVSRDTQDCYIRSEGPMVAALGVRNLVIVATKGAILVMDRSRGQELKMLVDEPASHGSTMKSGL